MNDSIFVEVYQNPIIDSLWLNKDMIFQGEEVIVNIQTNDFINWIGYNNNNSILLDYPEDDNCYMVQVYNQFNCIIVINPSSSVVDLSLLNKKYLVFYDGSTLNQASHLINLLHLCIVLQVFV